MDSGFYIVIGLFIAWALRWAYEKVKSKIETISESFTTFSAYVKADQERVEKLNVILGRIAEECANTRKAAEIVRDTVTNAVAGTVPGVDPQVQRYLAMVEGWRQQGMDQGEAEKLAADAFMKEIEGQF